MRDSYHNTHLGSIGQMKYGSSNIYRIWEKTINQIWEQHHLSNTEEDHTPHMGATPYTKYGRRPYTEYGSSTIYLGAPYTWQQHHIPNMLKSCRKHFFTFVCCYVKHWLNLIHTCFTKWWKSFLKHGSISHTRAQRKFLFNLMKTRSSVKTFSSSYFKTWRPEEATCLQRCSCSVQIILKMLLKRR